MTTTDCSDFKWDELLARIDGKNVIPVIGQALYWVRNQAEGNFLLYHHLSDKLAKAMAATPPAKKNPTFSEVAFRYLEKNPNDYLGLKRFLTKNLSSLHPAPDGPLWKLARIKPLSLFINTTYDHFLEQTLNTVRSYPTEVLHHTYREKRTGKVNTEMLEMLEDSRSSLVCHIYGSAAKNMNPAYTEKDILETVVTFQKDMETDTGNPLFQALKEKSLLFIGCGYDDWLFRFFIRTFANEPYQTPRDPLTLKFIGEEFNSFNCGELARFLKAYDSEVFYSGDGKDFVDLLFDKIAAQYPQHIIPFEEFPGTAFISFHGANRSTAMRLASLLREDGIKIWLDQRELKPGDNIDETIVKAIAKCPAFIPIISQEAKQFQNDDDKAVKYHIREWEWAYSRKVEGQNPRVIIPVKIDGTDWLYEYFNRELYIHIPHGNRNGDYEKLRDRLLVIQNNTRSS